MTSSPIRIERVAPIHTPKSSKSTATGEWTASPGGRLYGSTPGGSRIVYSREQLMSLATSPLVHEPLRLRGGAQGIPAQIARHSATFSGSPEKSSMRGMAMLKHASAVKSATTSTRQTSPSRRPSSSNHSAFACRSECEEDDERSEADATLTTSDAENKYPLRAVACRTSGKDAVVQVTNTDTESPTSPRRGRNRQARVSLGALNAGTQAAIMEHESSDEYAEQGTTMRGQLSARQHERENSSSTASSITSGPPSSRSSISGEAPFLMEL